MSQYDIVEHIFESDGSVPKEKLISKIDLHSSSVEVGIKQCVKKGYIEETQHGYNTVDSFDEEKLESIRPKTTEELMNNS